MPLDVLIINTPALHTARPASDQGVYTGTICNPFSSARNNNQPDEASRSFSLSVVRG